MNRSLISTVEEYALKNSLLSQQSTIVIGLSGGPDSVFLTHILSQLMPRYGLKLVAAHLDHEWRETAKNDVLFCRAFAESLSIPFVHAKASDIMISKKYNGSKEELGRLLRRTFFENVAHDFSAHAIALGHHEDDQRETFLMRLIRGATVEGLACMAPRDGLYIRPLLNTAKQEILAYLHTHHISYQHDETNDSPDFLRNRIRSMLLPTFAQCDNRAVLSLDKTINNMQETNTFLEKVTEKVWHDSTHTIDEKRCVLLTEFMQLDPLIQKRLLIKWLCYEKVPFTPSNAFLQELIRYLVEGRNPHHEFCKGWRLTKKGPYAHIEQCAQ